MWMMGYNDSTDFHIPADPFTTRKLRPIVPRPIISPTSNPSTPPPCLNLTHGTDFLTLNHLAEQNKREFSSQPVVVSSRWNPTPEQLRTLEELYRRGTRTPSADQIQHITSQLRRYGKIEGKNVFYWFQNHKARERQKRRRQRESPDDDKKDSGTERTRYEIEQNKNWPHSINSSTLSEKGGKVVAAAECRATATTDGWIQFEEGELEQRRNFVQGNDTWQMIQLSCLSQTHLLNTEKMDPSLVKSPDLDIFMAPCREIGLNQFINSDSSEDGYGEPQTLQLFPIQKDDDDGDDDDDHVHENDDHDGHDDNLTHKQNTNFTASYKFFEFLPLKN